MRKKNDLDTILEPVCRMNWGKKAQGRKTT